MSEGRIPSRVLPFIWYFVKSCRFKILQVYSISMINDAIYLFGGAYAYKILLNHANSNTLFFKNDIILVLFFVYSAVNFTLTGFLIKSADIKWRNSVEFKLTTKMLLNAVKHNISYFNNNLSGNLAAKIKNVIDNVNEIFFGLYYVLFNNIAFCICLAIFWTISIKLFIFSLSWCLSYYIVLMKLRNKVSSAAENNAKEKSVSMGIINDCFANISNIKIFSSEKKEYKIIRKQSLNILRSEARSLHIKNKMQIATYFFISIFIFTTVAITFPEFKKGKIDLGTIMFVLGFSSFVCWFIMNAIKKLTDIINYCGIINDALKLLTQPIQINDKNKANKIVINSGKIVFKNIKFSYDGE